MWEVWQPLLPSIVSWCLQYEQSCQTRRWWGLTLHPGGQETLFFCYLSRPLKSKKTFLQIGPSLLPFSYSNPELLLSLTLLSFPLSLLSSQRNRTGAKMDMKSLETVPLFFSPSLSITLFLALNLNQIQIVRQRSVYATVAQGDEKKKKKKAIRPCNILSPLAAP